MLETYQSLLMQDTTGMDEDVKAEHVLALRCLRESLFKKMTKVFLTVPFIILNDYYVETSSIY